MNAPIRGAIMSVPFYGATACRKPRRATRSFSPRPARATRRPSVSSFGGTPRLCTAGRPRGLGSFRGDAPPRAWLASIADNAVKNRYRSRSRFRRVFAGSYDDSPGLEPRAAGNGPEDDARAGESRRLVTEALKQLEPEFRMPVVLRDIEEWSYDEIAVSLSLPIGTVKSRIARGRGQLREILAPLLSGRWP